VTCWSTTPVKLRFRYGTCGSLRNYTPAPRWTAWNTHGKATPIISALLGAASAGEQCAGESRKWLFQRLDGWGTKGDFSSLRRKGRPIWERAENPSRKKLLPNPSRVMLLEVR